LKKRIAELEAERDDYKDRWEQTGCTRHGAMEAAIKTNDSLLKRIEELEQAIEEHIEWAEKVIDCTDLHEALGGGDDSS
jgi:hypothetical protein